MTDLVIELVILSIVYNLAPLPKPLTDKQIASELTNCGGMTNAKRISRLRNRREKYPSLKTIVQTEADKSFLRCLVKRFPTLETVDLLDARAIREAIDRNTAAGAMVRRKARPSKNLLNKNLCFGTPYTAAHVFLESTCEHERGLEIVKLFGNRRRLQAMIRSIGFLVGADNSRRELIVVELNPSSQAGQPQCSRAISAQVRKHLRDLQRGGVIELSKLDSGWDFHLHPPDSMS